MWGRFRVVEEVRHPQYKTKGNIYAEYDFKLLRILGYAPNKPIDLDDGKSGNTGTGTSLTIMGWGTTEGGSASSELREAEVDVIDFSECKNKYDSLSEANEKLCSDWGMGCSFGRLNESIMFCAGRTEGGTTYDSCTGDSGGPIVKLSADNNMNDVQVGVVSFGEGCGNPDYPGVYSKVSVVKDWIDLKIDEWDCRKDAKRRQLKKQKVSKGKKTKKIKVVFLHLFLHLFVKKHVVYPLHLPLLFPIQHMRNQIIARLY